MSLLNSEFARILIVDDEQANRMLLSDFVETLGHEPQCVATGMAALEFVRSHPVDLVLLDIMLPELTGYEVLDIMREEEALRHIPIIMISGVDEHQSVARCIQNGADDYLTKPFSPVLLQARIHACLDRKRLHDLEAAHREELELRVKEAVKRISQTQLATIFAMSKLAESRDPETGEHLERMREYARAIAVYLRDAGRHAGMINEQYMEDLYAAAPLHDIGKVGIPDQILQKPGPLTKEEFEIMKLHPALGAETLRAVDQQHPGNNFLKMGVEIAQSHHEKWDGSGYPDGLAGEDIPLAARILALADVYDALTSKRVYKEAFSHEKSRGILLEGGGKHFDPEIVAAFEAQEDRFIQIREQFQDSEKQLISGVTV